LAFARAASLIDSMHAICEPEREAIADAVVRLEAGIRLLDRNGYKAKDVRDGAAILRHEAGLLFRLANALG